MTNERVRQTRKCTQRFTASKRENALFKLGSPNLQITFCLSYLLCCPDVLPNLDYRNGEKIMFAKGWAFKKLWVVVAWVEMLSNGLLQSHTPADNTGYYAGATDFGEIVFFCMTKSRWQ